MAKILLDTHILLWALSGSKRLTAEAKKMILDPDHEIYISIVSPWEVEIKHDKYPDRMTLRSEQLLNYCSMAGYSRLSIKPRHIAMLPSLRETIHKDPFDRMLICQAKAEDMILMTHDTRIASYGEDCIMQV